jgi:hypothetical protein
VIFISAIAIAAGDLKKGIGAMIEISKRLEKGQWRQFLERLQPVLSAIMMTRHYAVFFIATDLVYNLPISCGKVNFGSNRNDTNMQIMLSSTCWVLRNHRCDLPKVMRRLANRLQLLLWTTKVVFPTNCSRVLIEHVLAPQNCGDLLSTCPLSVGDSGPCHLLGM